MGIFLNLYVIPQRIEPERWRKAYLETLKLIEAYPFMDIVEEKWNGIRYRYTTRTKHVWDTPAQERGGWSTIGDLVTGSRTEWFTPGSDITGYLPRNGVTDNGVDILLTELYGFYDLERPNTVIDIWGKRLMEGKRTCICWQLVV